MATSQLKRGGEARPTGLIRRDMLPWFAGLLLVLLAAYSNHFGNSFQFDDWHAVQYNPAIRTLSNIPLFFRDATTFSILPTAHSYRPLVTASLAVDYALGEGLKPFWFHLSTFFWFLVQLTLMYVLFVQVFERTHPDPRNPWLAGLAAAIYGLHPASAETVNYIVQRGDLYVALGIVAGVVVYARAPRARRFGLYLLPALGGMLAKPPALVFAPILLVYILLIDRTEGSLDRGGAATSALEAIKVGRSAKRTGRQQPARIPARNPKVSEFAALHRSEARGDGHVDRGRRRELLVACARSIPAFVLTVAFAYLEKQMTPATFVGTSGSSFDYWITQPYVALRYFRAFFLPLYLSADTDLQPFQTLWSWPALAGFGFCAFLVAAAIAAAHPPEWRPVSFGLWWFLIGLVPTSLYPLAEVENDHRMYLPFVGLTISVVWTVAILLRRSIVSHRVRMAVAGLSLAVLASFAWGTHRRNEVWHTENSLWRDVVEKSPRNTRGLLSYGSTLLADGQVALAYDYYQRASAVAPSRFRNNVEADLGTAAGALCRDAEAESHFQRAIQLAPHDCWGYIGYANLHLARGETELALRSFRDAYQQKAFILLSSYGLMDALLWQPDWDGLRSVADDVLRYTPGDSLALSYTYLAKNWNSPVAVAERRASSKPTAQNFLDLSLIYRRAGRDEDSLHAAGKVLELEPGSPWGQRQIAAARWSLSRKACKTR